MFVDERRIVLALAYRLLRKSFDLLLELQAATQLSRSFVCSSQALR